MAREVYIPTPQEFELRPFQDRVLELLRLFHDSPSVRRRVVGRIAAGEPIEATEDAGDTVEIEGPAATARQHPLLPLIREYLCPALLSLSADAFAVARVITPLASINSDCPVRDNPQRRSRMIRAVSAYLARGWPMAVETGNREPCRRLRRLAPSVG